MSDIQQMDEMNLIKRNLDRPPLKDTVTVPVGGYTIIRFITNNPGTWLFHCHLDFHSEVGMSIIIKVGTTNDLPKEPIGWPQCGDYVFRQQNVSSDLPSINQSYNFMKFNFFLFISSNILVIFSTK